MKLRLLGIALWLLGTLQAAHLSIEFKPQWLNEPIAYAESWHATQHESSLSLSRIAFLVSEPVLVDATGTGHRLSDWYGLVDLEAGQSTLTLSGLPSDKFTAIEFSIGLNPQINQSDPAKFAPTHALNPIYNKLHWNWQDGYIFIAIEGYWKTPQEQGGFSYHLGNEPHRMRIRIPATIDLSKNDARLILDFHLDRALENIPFDKATSTHGRHGDPLARQLKKQVEQAFAVNAVILNKTTGSGTLSAETTRPHLGTPFPLKISAHLPLPSLPEDYPLSKERVELGRRLFHDASLSRDNSVSCVSCHRHEHAFADNRKLSTGIHQQFGKRNAMPLMNLAWKAQFFWDGRAHSLREQALLSIQNETEMDASLPAIEEKLSQHPAYPSLFKAAYGSHAITAERIGVAIEQFLLSQISDDSRFDRALRGKAELTEIEKRGLELFFTEHDPRRQLYGADCFHCHGGPLFSDQAFHNNGLRLTSDRGRAAVSQRDADIGKFSTPSLRNVEITAPYMHDGRFETLEAVVEHYSSGLHRSQSLNPNLAKHPGRGIPLTAADKSALVAFLKTLTDTRYFSARSE